MIRHLLFWFVLAAIAVLNGIVRTTTYGRAMPDLASHQVSTLTGIIATGIAAWALWKFWPLESAGQAWLVGIAWLAMTVAFEFLFGHFIAGHPWQRLFNDYNLFAGRVWVLFLLWILVMPWVYFRVK